MDFCLFYIGIKLKSQAVIKSAASAASLDWQGSPRAPSSASRAVVRGLPCQSREAALAADLIVWGSGRRDADLTPKSVF